MSGSVIVGLIIQVLAVVLMAWELKARWVAHVGATILFVAFLYHGLTEVVQALYPGMNQFRTLTLQSDIDDWMLIISPALLLFAVVYILTLRWRQSKKSASQPAMQAERNPLSLLPPWFVFFAMSVPGYLVVVSGEDQSSLGYWIAGLTGQFLIFGIILTSATFVQMHRSLLPIALLTQSILLLLIGSRLTLFVAVFVVLSSLVRYGLVLSKKQSLMLILLLVTFPVIISSTRAVLGRDVFAEQASKRVAGLLVGMEDFSKAGEGILNDFVYRFDGNAYNAMTNSAIRENHSLIGLRTLITNFDLAVPRFVNPAKLERVGVILDEKLFSNLYYGLPTGYDYVPGTFGILFGYFGTIGLMVMVMLAAFVFGNLDIWFHSSRTQLSILLFVGLMYSAVFYEQGVAVYFITLRGVLVLYLLLTLITLIGRVLDYVRKRGSSGKKARPVFFR